MVKMNVFNKPKTGYWIIFALVVLFIVITGSFHYFAYQYQLKITNDDINRVLKTSLVAVREIMSTCCTKETTCPEELFSRKQDKLNRFIADAGLVYAFTCIEKDDQVYFTGISSNIEKYFGKEYGHLEVWQDPPEPFFDALETEEIVYGEDKTDWYDVQTAFIRNISDGSGVYVIGVGYDISIVQEMVQVQLSWIIFSFVFSLVIGLPLLFIVGLSIKKRSKADRKASENEEYFKITLNSIGDAVISTDKNGFIRGMNPLAQCLIGYDSKDCKGHHVKEILKIQCAQTGKPVQSAIEQIILQDFKEKIIRNEILISKEGKACQIADTTSPILDVNGNVMGVVMVFRDITEDHKVQELIRQSEKKYRGYIENAPLGIFILDDNQNFLDVNRMACEMTGFSREELLSMKIPLLDMTENTLPEEERFDAIKKSGYVEYERVLRRRDGSEFYISMIGIAMPGGKYIAFASDITEKKESELRIKETNDQLKREKKLAEEANRAKGEFLANMSHELRTPLNGIIGFSQILKDTPLKPEQQEYIEDVIFSSKNLIHIIEDILDYSKIEAGHFAILYDGADLVKLLHKSVKVIQPVAEKKGIAFNLNIDHHIQGIYETDALRLNQVLVNLLGNAVKFTEKGQIDFDINLLKDNANCSSISFSVTDTGIGIEENAKEKILQHFTQADYSITRRFGGTGLGLAITNSILNMMGSTLIIKSRLGIGSCFSFVLDLKKRNQSHNNDEEIENPLIKESFNCHDKIKILIAEDDPISLKLEKTLLRKIFPEATIFTATDGEEGLRLFEKNRPALIFMDLHMPKLNGMEATEKIRKMESHGKKSIIIGLSADALKERADIAVKKGMNSYMTKPINKKELLTVLSEYFNPEN